MIKTFEEFINKLASSEREDLPKKIEICTEIARYFEEQFNGVYSFQGIMCPDNCESILTFILNGLPMIDFNLRIEMCSSIFDHVAFLRMNEIKYRIEEPTDLDAFIAKAKRLFIDEFLIKVKYEYLEFKKKYPEITREAEENNKIEIGWEKDFSDAECNNTPSCDNDDCINYSKGKCKKNPSISGGVWVGIPIAICEDYVQN